MPAATLKERWIGIVANNENEPPPGDFVRILADSLSESGLPDLSTEKGQEAIQPHIGGAELIIVDNLSTLARTALGTKKTKDCARWPKSQVAAATVTSRRQI